MWIHSFVCINDGDDAYREALRAEGGGPKELKKISKKNMQFNK
jgi:hypothetical protein